MFQGSRFGMLRRRSSLSKFSVNGLYIYVYINMRHASASQYDVTERLPARTLVLDRPHSKERH